MNKNSLLALAISVLVILLPFRLAFIDADQSKPLFTGLMFLLTVGGTFLSLALALKSSN